jgi:hypothetical protein
MWFFQLIPKWVCVRGGERETDNETDRETETESRETEIVKWKIKDGDNKGTLFKNSTWLIEAKQD